MPYKTEDEKKRKSGVRVSIWYLGWGETSWTFLLRDGQVSADREIKLLLSLFATSAEWSQGLLWRQQRTWFLQQLTYIGLYLPTKQKHLQFKSESLLYFFQFLFELKICKTIRKSAIWFNFPHITSHDFALWRKKLVMNCCRFWFVFR